MDESGFRKSWLRPYGYSAKGKRCYGRHDWQGRNQTNAIGALHGGNLFAVGLFDCSITREIFSCWLKKLLIPNLPEKSVVVMDNATFHKGKDIVDALHEAGHTILWLPPYSPDLNPIENKWAEVKHIRNSEGIDDIDELFRICSQN